MRLLPLIIGILLTVSIRNPGTQTPSPASKLQTAKSLVRPLGPGRFQIGKVIFDQRKRELSFPAQVNLRDTLIEYAIVGKTGKQHESLLKTEVPPAHIHLAMLLLGTQNPPTQTEASRLPPGHTIDILIAWQENVKKRTGRLEDWIIIGEDKRPVSKGKWIYNGARIDNGHFTADTHQSIVALIIDLDALANNPRTGNENDEIWFPNETKIPALGTTVQVTFKLKEH